MQQAIQVLEIKLQELLARRAQRKKILRRKHTFAKSFIKRLDANDKQVIISIRKAIKIITTHEDKL